MATQYNGSNQCMEAAHKAQLTFGSGDFAVMLWVKKMASSVSWTNTYGLSKWNTGASPGTNEWVLSLTNGGSDDKPNFFMEDGSTIKGVTWDTNLTIGQWYHILATRVGNTLYLFVDAVQRDTEDVTGFTMNNNSRKVVIASHDPITFHTYMQAFDLRVYNRGLTQNEIDDIVVARGSDCIIAGLQARWRQVEYPPGVVAVDAVCVDDCGLDNGNYRNQPTVIEDVGPGFAYRRRVAA
jgi:hypothetical protein